MAEPGLISDYLAELAAELPGRIVEELADGLGEAYHGHLSRGLAESAAAQAALAEFGAPQVIVAGFADASPARRIARRLLAAGPAAGMCWGLALISARAWAWPVPVTAQATFGLILITVIGLLCAAARAQRYRSTRHAAAAACAGTAVLDAAMTGTVLAIVPAVAWPLALAVAVSGLRFAFAISGLRQALTG